LFNWLQGDVYGARCLEPFAGSGILSIEALSRGAAHCTVLDSATQATNSIRSSLEALGATQQSFRCENNDARSWLAQCRDRFNIIFLDPPFADGDCHQLILLCLNCLESDGYLYVETPEAVPQNPEYKIIRQKRAGAVHYALLSHTDP
jgi:16S rRNA (guanine966-N2)-methyltransferase